MNKYKKWLLATICTMIVGLLAEAAVVVWVDPFFQYHAPLENFPYLVDNQLSQNPGMICI